MNKHFIRTADQETANILKSIGFPQVGYTKGIYTFANCSSLSFANVNIDIKNSYNGELNYKNGKIETKKHDKNMHGIGLESVKTAVEKHYGTMDIHHNNKEFHVNIMLYL